MKNKSNCWFFFFIWTTWRKMKAGNQWLSRNSDFITGCSCTFDACTKGKLPLLYFNLISNLQITKMLFFFNQNDIHEKIRQSKFHFHFVVRVIIASWISVPSGGDLNMAHILVKGGPMGLFYDFNLNCIIVIAKFIVFHHSPCTYSEIKKKLQ